MASILALLALSAIQAVWGTEIDMTSYVTSVHDGGTFSLTTGDKVGLADLNAPELGDEGADDATDCLDSLVYGKNVYLNADDKYKTDSFGRLVCVAYADYNSTHYLNVNRTLIDGGYAKARNYDNDSISTHLRLTFLKLSPTSQREMILLSASLARLWC